MKARMEYRYDAAHPAFVELAREAALRDVSLQQHITDLLIGRYLARHHLGALHELLWLPNAPPVAEAAAAETLAEAAAGARALADEWL
jgi:hypothetical protein